MRRREIIRSRSSLALAFLIILSGQMPSVVAQKNTANTDKPVNISFGQPSIWSLEQAHYLLARMRDQSLDLRTRMPNGDDLNPNASNGTRLRSLRTFFGAGVNFDQTAGLQSKLFRDNAKFSSARRDSLLTTRDQLQTEQRAAAAEHSRLKIERSLMNLNGATDAQKEHKNIEVAEAAAREQQLTTGVANVDSELTALNVPAGELTTVTPPDAAASKLPDSVVDSLLESEGFRNELSNDVRLNASTVLENHVQMQYEIIAKQLTLLRDEVGPGERLVFLELPHSIYTVPDKADRRLAQVWWRVTGYYEKDPNSDSAPPETTTDGTPCPTFSDPNPSAASDPTAFKIRLECSRLSADRPKSQADIVACSKRRMDAGNQIRTVDLIPRQSSLNVNDIQDKVKNFNLSGAFNFLFGLGGRVDYQRQRRLYEQFMHQDIYASAFGKGTRDFGWTLGPVPGTERIAPGLHTTYAVLVVPDKAEAIELRAKGCFFKRAGYAPRSFDDTLSTGLRNIDCSASSQSAASQSGNFVIPIPGTSQNNFWVTGVEYKPVKPGERAVVIIHGDYFSPQVGVLVDGVPLRRAVGVAQVEVLSSHRSDEYTPEPRGEMEFITSRQLVLAFTMSKDYEGTPSIALVTPGRARVINDLRLIINDSYKCAGKTPFPNSCRCIPGTIKADGTCKLEKYKMFPEPPELDEKETMYVRLKDRGKLFTADVPSAVLAIGELSPQFIEGDGDVNAYLTGTGTKFNGAEEVIVNGVNVSGKTLKTPRLYELTFPSGNAEQWNITIVQTTEDAEGKPVRSSVAKTFPNPFRLKIAEEPKVLSYNPKARTPALVVKLVGSGFTSTLRATYQLDGKTFYVPVAFVSSREVVLTLTTPPEVAVVTLTDEASRHSVATVVNRPPPPEKEPEPKFKVFEGQSNGDNRPR